MLIEGPAAIYWEVKGYGRIEQMREVAMEGGIDRKRKRGRGDQKGGWGKEKQVSEWPAMQINSDKLPEGVVKNKERESDIKIQRYSERNKHSRIQAGWMPVQVRSGKHSRVVEPCSRCPCWHWKSTLLPTWPQTDSTQCGGSQYTDANANRLLASNLKSLEKIPHTEVFFLF